MSREAHRSRREQAQRQPQGAAHRRTCKCSAHDASVTSRRPMAQLSRTLRDTCEPSGEPQLPAVAAQAPQGACVKGRQCSSLCQVPMQPRSAKAGSSVSRIDPGRTGCSFRRLSRPCPRLCKRNRCGCGEMCPWRDPRARGDRAISTRGIAGGAGGAAAVFAPTKKELGVSLLLPFPAACGSVRAPTRAILRRDVTSGFLVLGLRGVRVP